MAMRLKGRWLAGSVTGLVGLGALLSGLPHLVATGQLDPRDWLVPAGLGAALLLGVLRWTAALAAVLPPLLLCLAGKGEWRPGPARFPEAERRPVVGVLSGPVLHGPVRGGFQEAPLWRVLSRRFVLRPVDALHEGVGRGMAALLLVQPRGLAPEELVALDSWVRMGGRAILLVDPDLRWADERPPGHPLRAPSVTLLDPLLRHWGLELASAPPRKGGDPVERRFLDDGRMVQLAGASHFLPADSRCSLSSGGLVARCRVGRGAAILVADADFANDALWTADPGRPERIGGWTSDAVPFLADLLAPGAGEAAGRRLWLARADGLPGALRPALMLLLALVLLVAALSEQKEKRRGSSQSG